MRAGDGRFGHRSRGTSLPVRTDESAPGRAVAHRWCPAKAPPSRSGRRPRRPAVHAVRRAGVVAAQRGQLTPRRPRVAARGPDHDGDNHRPGDGWVGSGPTTDAQQSSHPLALLHPCGRPLQHPLPVCPQFWSEITQPSPTRRQTLAGDGPSTRAHARRRRRPGTGSRCRGRPPPTPPVVPCSGSPRPRTASARQAAPRTDPRPRSPAPTPPRRSAGPGPTWARVWAVRHRRRRRRPRCGHGFGCGVDTNSCPHPPAHEAVARTGHTRCSCRLPGKASTFTTAARGCAR